MDITEIKPSETQDKDSPRYKAETLICRALEIIIQASEQKDPDTDNITQAQRDFTLDELEELFCCLTFASTQLKQLPGGVEALRNTKNALSQALESRKKSND